MKDKKEYKYINIVSCFFYAYTLNVYIKYYRYKINIFYKFLQNSDKQM